ncbi:hypothetical protein AALP_AA5G073700 [Arabis alpina]|uniref:Uncharacterized protein n=1 Tax=Arabis alpina TaxID=50452 RepID=A0A087GVI8_ARAAL|nr:hypothetical protein AALP_AA5G073700 [Arabis alpina]
MRSISCFESDATFGIGRLRSIAWFKSSRIVIASAINGNAV